MKSLLFKIVFPVYFMAFFIGCKQPQAPQYAGIANFKISSLGLGESVVSADLKYFNPNNFNMKLKYGEMDVYLNNRFIGKTLLDTLTAIPANDSFLIPVSMKVDMKQIYSNAFDILLSRETEIKLDGFAKLGKGGFYFNVPINYAGRQKIDIGLN
jgi:LEA14-like dessication related protein